MTVTPGDSPRNDAGRSLDGYRAPAGEPLKACSAMCAHHDQIGTQPFGLREDFSVNRFRVDDIGVDWDTHRMVRGGEFRQLAQQTLTNHMRQPELRGF